MTAEKTADDATADDCGEYHSTARAVMGPVADVPVEYTEQVSWAFQNGIAEGITDTEFGVYPASETAFVPMLLNALGYQGQYEYAHALHFAESIGLAPLGLSRNFTLGDAALYLQAAMDLQTADGTNVRKSPRSRNRLRFPTSSA